MSSKALYFEPLTAAHSGVDYRLLCKVEANFQTLLTFNELRFDPLAFDGEPKATDSGSF